MVRLQAELAIIPVSASDKTPGLSEESQGNKVDEEGADARMSDAMYTLTL